MKKISNPLRFVALFAAVGSLTLVVWLRFSSEPLSPRQKVTREAQPSDPLRIVLTRLAGDAPLDRQIGELQTKVEAGTNRNALLERLGWAFVAKARLSSDPGFYTLAEQAAKVITRDVPDDPAALLLLGHIRDAQHRFAEAEAIARGLTARREFVFDYALLGDALMEQGKLSEAVEAYQKMVDLKPCLQTYSRVAHMRWLKGDLKGALGATRLAVSAGSSREPEPTAWAYTRLALYLLQDGDLTQAMTSTDLALQFAPDYAPALLMRGRLLLGQAKHEEAIAPLQRAAAISPLPDYLWPLADALRATGRDPEANEVEARLTATGPAADARTFAVFLATKRRDASVAQKLAVTELESRQDIFTHDAVAWAQLANGRVQEARDSIGLALAESTKDARLFYHAGAIAAAAGEGAEALQYFGEACSLEQMLLPSERQDLSRRSAALLARDSQISLNQQQPNNREKHHTH